MFDPVITDDQSINEDSYDGLVSLIEASQGVLSLLIASCEPGDFQNQIINRYEAELAPNISSYRVVLNQQEPSLRAALEQLTENYPELRTPGASAVITVTGTADLMEIVLNSDSNHQSELSRFFGYLQWTREGLREFLYPIVLWVMPKILSQLSLKSPDFWSWRSGVFRFIPPDVVDLDYVSTSINGEVPQLILSEQFSSLPLEELLEQVKSIEKQNNTSLALASLYDRLGQAYGSRIKLKQSEDLQWEKDQAIGYFQKAIEIQTKLNTRSDRVNTLIRLGQFYSDFGKHRQAQESYQRALKTAREINDRVGEAASLAGLGNTYQQPVLDESSVRPYVNLIEHLLVSPQGQEAEILQANAELVDTGLVAVMQEYASYLEGQQGNANATWLRELAVQLEQVLSLRQAESTGTTAAAQFLLEILQLIAQTRGNRAQVYEFFRANVGRLDEALLRALPDLFAPLIQQNDSGVIAAVFGEFGNLIQQFPLGNRMLNLEMGIASFEQALQVHTRDAFPEQWAGTQNNLALAYSNRIRGERADNLERAIIASEQALQVYTRDAFPKNWAATQNNLANAYSERIRGERADNLKRAITAYEQALQVRTRDAFPEQWAATQNNLALAYSNRIQGERADNLERAITAYEQALQVRNRTAFPEDWATTQNNLALAYSDRIRGERADNLERAITAFEQALQVRTRDAFPEDWATTQNNLANAYSNRIRGERADNLERAITAYEQALQVRTRDAFPEQWAGTQNNLAAAYSNHVQGDRAENIEQAIAAYESALQVYIRDAFPEQWAMTLNNLAIAYSRRIRGEHSENIERALMAHEQALQVYTRDAFPEQWARVQNNLVVIYSNRIRGDRAQNLERAIEAYQMALQVYTVETFPIDWARMQNNLAIAYNSRIRGDRAENLEEAIVAYQQALQVYTRDALPIDWATTHNNLAIAYSHRIRGNREENLKYAILSYEQALQIRTPGDFPKDCFLTSQSLGNLHFQEKSWVAAVDAYQIATVVAETLYQSSISYSGKGDELKATADLPRRLAYAQAQLGNLQAAVLTLEQGRARGLSESLDRDRADLAQLQTLAPTLHTDYQTITQQLRNLESGDRDRMVSTDRDRVPEDLINATTKLRKALENTIAQIRQVPIYEDFLTQTRWQDIEIALRQDNPLVYLVTTPNGGMVLTVTVDAIEILWLNDLTETQLIDLLNQTWFAAYGQSQIDRQAWYDAINATTRQLWDLLMGAIVQHLKTLGIDRITLIPTGYLSLLPLHAAWTEDDLKPTGRRYAFDDIHITYAPNAKSLTAAQSIADRVNTDSILAIDDPFQTFPSSGLEVSTAIATFHQHKVLKHEQATISAVLAALPNYDVLHLCCHGTANLQAPLASGLLMSDGLITLRDILAFQFKGIRLAILSADETGLPGITLADEVISLPTGLLQAGVAGVIAPFWAVSDFSTMMLFTRFYDLWRSESLEIDQALRQAQQWVRDTTNREKIAYFKASRIVGNLPANVADYLYKSLILSRPDEQDFAHPFHWAAFNYIGV